MEVVEASGIDGALGLLGISGGKGGGVDRHPERRMKAVSYSNMHVYIRTKIVFGD